MRLLDCELFTCVQAAKKSRLDDLLSRRIQLKTLEERRLQASADIPHQYSLINTGIWIVSFYLDRSGFPNLEMFI